MYNYIYKDILFNMLVYRNISFLNKTVLKRTTQVAYNSLVKIINCTILSG